LAKFGSRRQALSEGQVIPGRSKLSGYSKPLNGHGGFHLIPLISGWVIITGLRGSCILSNYYLEERIFHVGLVIGRSSLHAFFFVYLLYPVYFMLSATVLLTAAYSFLGLISYNFEAGRKEVIRQ
jgi:hypothetical protein